MRRLTGLDLNGWLDTAARDWTPAESGRVLTPPTILDGGFESVAVQVNSGQWTGGPQAALAPHGRGGGWGEIGAEERRVALADEIARLLDGKKMKCPEAYASAVRALTYEAEETLIAVPDRAEFDEAAQGLVLNLLTDFRCNHRLLWRSVALFLDALQTKAIPEDRSGEQFRILIHAGDGIEVQTLRLRSDRDHPGHLAPEREGYGSVILADLGLAKLRARTAVAVNAANPQLGAGRVEQSRLPTALLCSKVDEGDTEVLRRENGTWLEVEAPALCPEMVFGNLSPGQDGGSEATVITTFLATPLKLRFANELATALAGRWPGLRLLPWEGIARGALHAGRLIERGLPHYFDKLEPIALAVRRGDEPDFVNLIGQNDTVPANREYVSPPHRGLNWGRGKTEMEFYILKGGRELRHWQVRQETGPREDAEVELRLRQTPGQSWAKLSVTSSEWEPLNRSPIFLDWAALTPSDMSPQEVLEKLRTKPPTIPERIVERPHILLWTGGEWYNKGLSHALERMELNGAVNPQAALIHLRSQLRDPPGSPDKYRAVGTDGALPDELSSEDEARFQTFMFKVTETIAAFTSQHTPTDNYAIGCLTWTFTLCPETVQEEIVAALEAYAAGRRHPLHSPRAAAIVLTQGAGRAVTGRVRLRRLLRALAKMSTNNNTINALAMILTRRAEAPAALTPELVDRFFEDLADSLLGQVRRRSFKVLFRNTLSALAGMFRWREIEPYALLAARDDVAARVREILTEAERELEILLRQVPQAAEKRKNIAAIIEYLDGQGDPNILHEIEKEEKGEDDAEG